MCRTAITALVALPRGGAADDVVRHLVECGIHAFGEVIAERSVRRVRQRGGNDNQVRFERLSLSAMKQCGLNVMPQLHPTCTVSELQCAPQTLGVFGSTAGTAPLLHEYVESLDRVPDAIAFVVGPEGGWTPAEEACLVDAGFSQVSLGPTTLRIETASIAMATFLAALR